MIEQIAKLIKASYGISIGLTGNDPYYLKDVARKLPKVVEGFPPPASDYIVIDPQGTDIGIDEVRQLSSFLFYSPESSSKKYILIFDIERMTQQAANALLKTLEEPPSFGTIICTTTRWHYLLPTIRSRLVRFYINPPKPKATHPWVSKIMEKDWRTRETKKITDKVKNIERAKKQDLLKMVKKIDEDPLMGYLAAFKLIDSFVKLDDQQFMKLYGELSSSLSGKEFFLFNATISRAALWYLELEGTENLNLIRFLDSVARAKIANFNNSLTLLNIMLRIREERREKTWN